MHASESCFRGDLRYDVGPALTRPALQRIQADRLNSALFSTYLIVSIYSLFPTAKEKAEREADRESDIEMKKVMNYSPESEESQEERWERNRQIFLNLPKTPMTPGFGAKNPMTPRTVAFTQLNGGPGPSTAGKGPVGGLKFREQYGESGVPDGR